MNINLHGSLKSERIQSGTMWNISLSQYLVEFHHWYEIFPNRPISFLHYEVYDILIFIVCAFCFLGFSLLGLCFLDWTLWYCFFYWMCVGNLFNVTVQHSNVWARSTENNWKKDVNESGISNSLHRSVYENQNKVVNESVILKNIKYFE